MAMSYITPGGLGFGRDEPEEELEVFDRSDVLGTGQLTAEEFKRLRDVSGFGQLVREMDDTNPDPNEEFEGAMNVVDIVGAQNPDIVKVEGLGGMSTRTKALIAAAAAIPVLSIVTWLVMRKR